MPWNGELKSYNKSKNALSLRSAMLFGFLVAGASNGFAQSEDLWTSFSLQKGGCGNSSGSEVSISDGRISSSSFQCKLVEFKPGAGVGLEAYVSRCVISGVGKTDGYVVLDSGNFKGAVGLMIPGREDWLMLHPCTPIPSLQ